MGDCLSKPADNVAKTGAPQPPSNTHSVPAQTPQPAPVAVVNHASNGVAADGHTEQTLATPGALVPPQAPEPASEPVQAAPAAPALSTPESTSEAASQPPPGPAGPEEAPTGGTLTSDPSTPPVTTAVSSPPGTLTDQLLGSNMTSTGSNPQSTWDKAKMLFALTNAEDLLADLHDLKYIGAGGYGKVFKAVWRSAPVAVKLVPSNSPELFNSSSYKEALLCKELCHPNIVQTYESRCARLTEEFVNSILIETETPLLGQAQRFAHGSQGQGYSGGATQSYGSQEFVSGDGFGRPSPVPDMLVKGKTLSEAAAKWKDILFTTGAKADDYLTVIIMDYCDYGSLVRPIAKGMFRPFSASGSDREARVRYRALLRTAKEIAQGLEHLHHLKVVHGDLKPGNVLLKGSRVDVRGFNAQVIDFGLSHMVNNSNPQKVSKAGGTLVYAAPEVFSGRVSKAADVYSLGIILWEMATGSQPYKDLVEGQIVLGVQKGRLRPAWPPGQLPQLQVLYEKCVAQDPEERPKAKEVVQYLTQIEMDLRSELKAAHRQQQQQQIAMQQQMALQQQLHLAQMQQQAMGGNGATEMQHSDEDGQEAYQQPVVHATPPAAPASAAPAVQ